MSAFPQPGGGGNFSSPNNFSMSTPLSPAAGRHIIDKNPNPAANPQAPTATAADPSNVWAMAQQANQQNEQAGVGAASVNPFKVAGVLHGGRVGASSRRLTPAQMNKVAGWARKAMVKAAMGIPHSGNMPPPMPAGAPAPAGPPPTGAPQGGGPAPAPQQPGLAPPPPPGMAPMDPSQGGMPPQGVPGGPGTLPPAAVADPSMQPVPPEMAQLAQQPMPIDMPVLTGMAADPDATPELADEAMKFDGMAVEASDRFKSGIERLTKRAAPATPQTQQRVQQQFAQATPVGKQQFLGNSTGSMQAAPQPPQPQQPQQIQFKQHHAPTGPFNPQPAQPPQLPDTSQFFGPPRQNMAGWRPPRAQPNNWAQQYVPNSPLKAKQTRPSQYGPMPPMKAGSLKDLMQTAGVGALTGGTLGGLAGGTLGGQLLGDGQKPDTKTRLRNAIAAAMMGAGAGGFAGATAGGLSHLATKNAASSVKKDFKSNGRIRKYVKSIAKPTEETADGE